MNHYYLLINENGVYVKEGAFFEATFANEPEEKRNAWERIEAEDLVCARQIGVAIRRWRYPKSHRTLGEESAGLDRHARPLPREPQTDYERSEAAASELRQEGNLSHFLAAVMNRAAAILHGTHTDLATTVVLTGGLPPSVPTKEEIEAQLLEVMKDAMDE